MNYCVGDCPRIIGIYRPVIKYSNHLQSLINGFIAGKSKINWRFSIATFDYLMFFTEDNKAVSSSWRWGCHLAVLRRIHRRFWKRPNVAALSKFLGARSSCGVFLYDLGVFWGGKRLTPYIQDPKLSFQCFDMHWVSCLCGLVTPGSHQTEMNLL